MVAILAADRGLSEGESSVTPPIKHYLQFSDFRPTEYAYLLARARASNASSRPTKTTRSTTARWP